MRVNGVLQGRRLLDRIENDACWFSVAFGAGRRSIHDRYSCLPEYGLI